MGKEVRVQQKVLEELEELGCRVYKLKPGYGVPTGTLDCVFFYKSFYGWIEFKASEDAPYRPLQEYNLDFYAQWSWSATIYPENKDEVMRELKIKLESIK